jgi:hypothetical protein
MIYLERTVENIMNKMLLQSTVILFIFMPTLCFAEWLRSNFINPQADGQVVRMDPMIVGVIAPASDCFVIWPNHAEFGTNVLVLGLNDGRMGDSQNISFVGVKIPPNLAPPIHPISNNLSFAASSVSAVSEVPVTFLMSNNILTLTETSHNENARRGEYIQVTTITVHTNATLSHFSDMKYVAEMFDVKNGKTQSPAKTIVSASCMGDFITFSYHP